MTKLGLVAYKFSGSSLLSSVREFVWRESTRELKFRSPEISGVVNIVIVVTKLFLNPNVSYLKLICLFLGYHNQAGFIHTHGMLPVEYIGARSIRAER